MSLCDFTHFACSRSPFCSTSCHSLSHKSQFSPSRCFFPTPLTQRSESDTTKSSAPGCASRQSTTKQNSSDLGTVCEGPSSAKRAPKSSFNSPSPVRLAIPHPHLRRMGMLEYLPPDPSVKYFPLGHPLAGLFPTNRTLTRSGAGRSSSTMCEGSSPLIHQHGAATGSVACLIIHCVFAMAGHVEVRCAGQVHHMCRG